jgi:glucose dehydrogenase
MSDPEKLVVAGLILLFLGGSLLAAVAVVDPVYLPVAGLAYLFVAAALLQRLRRAENPFG